MNEFGRRTADLDTLSRGELKVLCLRRLENPPVEMILRISVVPRQFQNQDCSVALARPHHEVSGALVSNQYFGISLIIAEYVAGKFEIEPSGRVPEFLAAHLQGGGQRGAKQH